MPESMATTWRSVVTDALWELDAAHRVDGATRPLCVTCGAADGSWPCVSRMVADDLRALLRDAGNGSLTPCPDCVGIVDNVRPSQRAEWCRTCGGAGEIGSSQAQS